MKLRLIKLTASCLALGLFATGANAQQTKGPGSESLPPRGGCVAIPDDGYDGSIGSMACVTVAAPAGAIDDLNVTIDMEHTWVGDLAVKVVAPDMTTATLMSRPGDIEPADDGTAPPFGNSDNLVMGAPGSITYDDQGGGPASEDMGGVGSTNNVCIDDALCNYVSSVGAATGTGLADFNGLTVAAGNWQVCVGDSAAADTGNLCGATLDITFAVVDSDVSVTKVATAPSPVVITSAVSYLLTASNAGPADAADAVVTDTLPANLTYVNNDCGATVAGQTVTWNIGMIANGANATCTINTTVNAVGAISNTASIAISNNDPNPANNAGTSALAGAMLADVAVALSSDAPANLGVGQQYTYTVTGSNAGPSDATSLLFNLLMSSKISFVSSTCGASAAGNTVSWSVPTLAAAATTSCDITVAVVAPGDIIVTASVNSATPDPNLVNNSTQLVVGFQATQVPTLGQFGLLLIGLLLAGVGVVAIRRS